ncbi:ABC transporter substrate-binding protein [Streptacidiphilus sp. ASG 303]|uniref:RsiG family protein n=1 Tax=Streptacidiphilus sp. ASG 303 TaxID=2896847 RepID=UPI001E3EAEC0|nr:ABC transporter substrate-binding protein [Streptacidiphilus sp. ASG 303]MCD0485581.1 ABC transporter substrate-binding protein [Streptacidiphilus sp. ASG 303]
MDEHSGPDGAAARAAGGEADLGMEELRALRRSAQEDEADLSYLRRLLQGRIDILRAELARRSGGPQDPHDPQPADTLVDRLPEILADGPGRFRSARHVTLATPRGERYGCEADQLMGDVRLSDLAAHGDPELAAALERLAGYEREVSHRRQALQRTVDRCSAEITRRYREGEARVDDLLAGG